MACPIARKNQEGRKEVEVGGDGKEGMDRKAEGKAFLLLKGDERDFLAQMTAPATMRDIRHCTAAKSLFNSSKPQHFLKMPLRRPPPSPSSLVPPSRIAGGAARGKLTGGRTRRGHNSWRHWTLDLRL